MLLSSHASQSGFLASHTLRPCQMIAIPAKIQSSVSRTFMRSLSIFTGSVASLNPKRCANRFTWVSTTTPLASPNASPRTTFAVYRATPRSRNNSSMVRGTSPLNSSMIWAEVARMDLALLRKNPVCLTISSTSACDESARALAVGNLRNKLGVTRLTVTSVVWADRMTDIKNWNADA